MMNTQEEQTGNAPRVIYSGKCYGQNRHWHLDTRGNWTYRAGIKCANCKDADQKYNTSQPNPMTTTQNQNTTKMNTRLSKQIRIDSRYSALCLLRWIRTTNQMVRQMKAHSQYHMTTRKARELVIATYGW